MTDDAKTTNLDTIIEALPAIAKAGVREIEVGDGPTRVRLKLEPGQVGDLAGLSTAQLRAIVASSDQLTDADPAQTPRGAQQDADDLDTAHVDP